MNPKILELLGEELAKQVTEKLGTVELGITNDGSLVPADKHDTMKAEFKQKESAYKEQIEGFKGQLESLSKEKPEELKGKIDQLSGELDKQSKEFEARLKQEKTILMIENELIKADVRNTKAVKALLDMESIKLEGEGIAGLTDQLTKLKETDTYLFKDTKPKGTPPKGDDNPPPQGQKAILIAKYNEAEKNRNAKEMSIIREQIKQLE